MVTEQSDTASALKPNAKPTMNPVDKMTLNEIFNGKDDGFLGLIPLIDNYLAAVDLDAETTCTLRSYLQFISKKASGTVNLKLQFLCQMSVCIGTFMIGELLTTASWLRNFVTTHPDYKHDSYVSEKINYDLMKTCRAMSSGQLSDGKLLCERAHLLRSGEKRRNTGPSNGKVSNGSIMNGGIVNVGVSNGSGPKPVQEILKAADYHSF